MKGHRVKMVLRKKKIKITEDVRSLSPKCLAGCLWDRQHAPEAMWFLPELSAEQLCSHHAGLQLLSLGWCWRERPQLGEVEQGSRSVNHKGLRKGISIWACR